MTEPCQDFGHVIKNIYKVLLIVYLTILKKLTLASFYLLFVNLDLNVISFNVKSLNFVIYF